MLIYYIIIKKSYFEAYYSKEINNFFNADKYLKKISSIDKNFYQTLISTQMFKNFIKQKMLPKNSFEMIKVIQFEEKINEITKTFLKKKSYNYLEYTQKYQKANDYEVPLPSELRELEIEFYKNEDNINKLIDNGVIILNDFGEKNEILFNYPIFPKLKHISFDAYDRIQNYIYPVNYDEEIEKINYDIISKLFINDNSSKKDKKDRNLYLSWICIWIFTFWYCDEKEKNFWFQELTKIIKNSLYYDIKIFNYLFDVLNKYGNESMILKLYTILIKNRWIPSLQVYNMAIKIIEKEKENNLLDMILNNKLNKEYKKKDFNKRVFGSKVDSKIIINYKFDSIYYCLLCNSEIDIESFYRNEKEIREDIMWVKCPNCNEFALPTIKVKYQEEKDKNNEMSQQVTIFSPNNLLDNCLTILNLYNLKYDVNNFENFFSGVFWSFIFYCKIKKLEYEFMLPYYYQIKNNDLNKNN